MTAMIQRPPTLDRLDLLAKIHEANAEAKKLRRRGPVGTLSQDYADKHAHLDWLLGRLGYSASRTTPVAGVAGRSRW